MCELLKEPLRSVTTFFKCKIYQAGFLRRNEGTHNKGKLKKCKLQDRKCSNPHTFHKVNIYGARGDYDISSPAHTLVIKPEIGRDFSCWICQMELSSESLLLQHYDNHMRREEELPSTGTDKTFLHLLFHLMWLPVFVQLNYRLTAYLGSFCGFSYN